MKFGLQGLYLCSRLLSTPLEAFYTLLIFIISWELHASSLQLTILAATKPLISLAAYFLSHTITGKSHNIRNYLIALNLVGCLPALFFPFTDNIWFLIAGYALFQVSQRGSFPSWGELLKKQMGVPFLSSLFSKSTSIYYFIMIAVPFLLSYWLDHVEGIWKFFFFSLACLQVCNSVLLLCLPSTKSTEIKLKKDSGLRLFMADTAFRRYLVVFFLGGAGLVAIQPVIPKFFNEILHLSYQELICAFSVCRGIAFISTSPFWARFTGFMSLYRLNVYVNVCSILFIACMLASVGHIFWIYIA